MCMAAKQIAAAPVSEMKDFGEISFYFSFSSLMGHYNQIPLAINYEQILTGYRSSKLFKL